jgi:hypothetical protein
MTKYIEIAKSEAGFERENDWFKHCESAQIPFITVKLRSKYADVHWDYIAYSKGVDEILEGLGNTIREGATELFKKYANTKSRYSVNGHLIWFKNLEVENARLAAGELYELIVASVSRGNARI